MAALGRGTARGAVGTRDFLRRHRTAAIASVLVAAVLGAGGWYGLKWWESRPRPVQFSLHANGPGLTPIEENMHPRPVLVQFGGSVARLDQIGKRIAAGITMTPAHPGEWRWQDDRTLIFAPAQDWPVGQEFKVALDRALFPEHVLLQAYEARFQTAPFRAAFTESQLYQDPRNPKIKRVVATVTFSHPVDTASFPKLVALRTASARKGVFGSAVEEIPFTVSFDKLRSQAYIHSDPVPIPANDTSITVVVKPGAKAAAGGPGQDGEIAASVHIPGMYNYFRVSGAEVTLVRNEKFEPEQVLILQVTDGVTEAEIQKNVQVWLLPKDLPEAPGRRGIRNYHWGDPTLIGKDVLAAASAVALTPVPTEREYSNLHSFKIQADVNRYLFLRIKKGTQSAGGYVLASEFSTVVAVPPFPQEVSVLHDGALLSLAGERKISVMARDLQALRFEIGRVLPSQINHLVSQTSGHFAHPSFQNYLFNEDNIVERASEVRLLEPVGRGKAQYAAFDFGPHLGGDRRGVFFFRAQAWDPVNKRRSGPEDQRLILVTDLGLLVKDNADGSHDLFVQSIGQGAPAAGATVSVLGKNGVAVLTQVTDEEGHARFPPLKDFTRERQPVAWLVTRGEDLAFMPLDRGDRQLNFTRFDVGGLVGASSPDRLSAFMFSDRGLYRPGDTFHVASIVKPSDWNQSIGGLPLEVTVTDPRGMEILSRKVSLPESGFTELDYTTEETSPTGNYQVSYYVVNDGRRGSLLGSTSVRVEEFLPDRMKIVTSFSTERLEGWVSPAGLKGRVSLKNLFGIPAANRRVAAELVLSPAYPVFRPYKEYRFFDPIQARQSFTERLEDTQTDGDGEAELELNLERFEKGTYRVSLLAEGYELEGGRGVSSEASVLVSPLPYLIGFKADGDLRYIQKDAARNVHLIAVDPTLTKVAAKGLRAQLTELRWVSVLTQLPNGTYQYQSVQKEIVVTKKELSLPADGLSYPLPTAQPGDFALSVRDAQDTEIARVAYSVAGRANLERALERNAELELKLQRTEYAAGEEIEMQIKAPYTGAGLITIERDRVYAQKWFKTDTTASVQTIRVPAGLEGNGYVNVSFVRSMSSPEIFTSPLSYAVMPFTVNHEARLNAITLESPDLARPGEPYRIRYKGQKPGKAVVFAIDEGILQVAAYQTPDPLAFFFKKRALEVRTGQILDLLLPELAMVVASSQGGDAEGMAAIGKNLNPFKRKRDKPVAYWSGIVDIDTAERELKYDVPDHFNGSLRVMAVAVSPQAVGAASRRAIVRGPFVLSPNVPTFVAPGDEFQVSLGVANTAEGSGPDAPVEVELKTSDHLEVLDGAARAIKVSEGREGSVAFRLRAKRLLGSGNLTFHAAWKDKKIKQSVDLSVRPPVPFLTTVSTGSVKDRKAEIPVTRRMYQAYRTNEVTASVVPLGMARGLVTYLNNFPYGCTEQIVSRAFPSLILRNRREFGVSTADAQRSFETAVQILRTRQNDRGAFGFWAANSYVSDFQTVYAMHYLLEAKERGHPVPAELMARGLNYLRQIASGSFGSAWQARDRAYAVYVLARAGEASGAFIAQLREQLDQQLPKAWQNDLIAAYLAGAYKAVKQDRLAEKALSEVKLTVASSDYAHLYDGLLHAAGVLYVVSRHFPERLDALSAEALEAIARPVMGGTFNTLSSSYSILALDAYLTALGERASVANVELVLSELVDGKPSPLKLPHGLFPRLGFSDQASLIRLDSSSDTPAFFQVTQAGFDLDVPNQEIKDRLEVQRELQTLEGVVVKEAPLGSEVEVHVKLRAISGGGISHVAIVDLLPGGFEVVMDRPQAPEPEEEEGAEHSEAEYSEHGEHEGGEEPYEGEGEGGGEGEGEGEGEGAEESGEQEYTADATPAAHGYVPPVGAEKSSFQPEYVDVREDRVVIFGTVGPTASEFVYRIKATNEGQYAFPPAFAEGMYDRKVRARSLAGTVKVVKP
jgi:hypothetical protein